ncbi:hypothetical protein DFH07DRAFT_846422 [Mycena maculata]|uniref:F-box domain-containing protein n=1 Tax=Mycena maculata TaxID=230809 RepID=A0AAD7I2J2_9AGAR|nr:hypothetical protein DFH07DRAFT_846422 [Mycena maculata]
MVLTRRRYKAYMVITRWLPNEIISEIIQSTPKADQATLCRVSKLFSGLTLPILNREVHILDADYSSAAFFSGLIANPARAEAIRCFSVLPILGARKPIEVPPTPPNNFCYLLLESMKLMRRLEHLRVLIIKGGMHTEFPRLLQLCTFPRLLTCHVAQSHLYFQGAPEGNFLTRHPTLTYLSVIPGVMPDPPPSTCHLISLPNVEHYDGSASLIPRIFAGGLKQARLRWHFHGEAAIEHLIVSLISSTNPDTLLHLSHQYNSVDQCMPIIRSVSIHMSYVRTLQMCRLGNIGEPAISLNDTIIREIATYLARFTGLAYFAIEPVFGRAEPPGGTEVSMQVLGDACPTLEACCLNSNAYKKVNGGWESCTALEFQVQAGLPQSWRQLLFA